MRLDATLRTFLILVELMAELEALKHGAAA